MSGYIVVTGAAGMIGSAVLRYLNDQGGSRLVVVDRLDETEHWKNLLGKRFLEILDKDQLWAWLEGRQSEVAAIIHLGACSSTVEKDAGFLLENNYRYTRRLAEYALKYDIRFIYASSAATYGDGSLGFSDDHDLLHRLQPLNMYGYSKHLFDLWAYDEGVLDQFVGLKYFNVFGPNEWHKARMASAVLHMYGQIQDTGLVKLFSSSEPERFGDGEQCRDFVYVKDVARITCSFILSTQGGIFNVGTGQAQTWNALASALFQALKREANIQYVPMPQDLLGKYQNYTCADVSKLQAALGDMAETQALEDSVADYVQGHLIEEKRW